jgi:hypothetical protein
VPNFAESKRDGVGYIEFPGSTKNEITALSLLSPKYEAGYLLKHITIYLILLPILMITIPHYCSFGIVFQNITWD